MVEPADADYFVLVGRSLTARSYRLQKSGVTNHPFRTRKVTAVPTFNLRLSHKIAAIGIAGVGGLFALGGIYLAGESSQADIRATAERATFAKSRQQEFFTDVLKLRRAEKDFLLRKDAKYVEQHNKLSQDSARRLDELARDIAAFSEPSLNESLKAIRAGYDKYQQHFAKLADARIRLGLTENAGLEGQLRASVHEIETALQKHNAPALMTIMLMMRRHEKDFMLRGDTKYVGDMRKRAGEFTAALEGSSVPADVRQGITARLNNYQRDFSAWAEMANLVAQEQKDVSASFAAIEPAFDAVEKRLTEMSRQTQTAEAQSRRATFLQMVVSIASIVLAVMVLAWLTGRSIVKPLKAMIGAMRRLASGDMNLTVPGSGRADEIGEMSQAVQVFKDSMLEAERLRQETREREALAAEQRRQDMQRMAREFETAVGEIIETVASASTELEAAATTLSRTADATRGLSAEASADSNTAAASAQTVASATEELAASVSEIGRQIKASTDVAHSAVQQAEQTDRSILVLAGASAKIGDIVDLITTIAEQTNLLALNATIEAARAGESGRGFAVVASEVKALASQTAKATGDIAAQISEIRNATDTSVSAIKGIGATITNISEITATIAAAVEEQGVATKDIAGNVQSAAEGSKRVANRMAELDAGATEAGAASVQVLSAAQSLSQDANRLKLAVHDFLATVRAA